MTDYSVKIKATKDEIDICIATGAVCLFATRDQWEQLKADVDSAITAFRTAEEQS